jgi:hypothetical protein
MIAMSVMIEVYELGLIMIYSYVMAKISRFAYSILKVHYQLCRTQRKIRRGEFTFDSEKD